MNRDFEKANRRDLTKRVYDPIASFRPAQKSSRRKFRALKRLIADRRLKNEELQRAYWPQKFLKSVAGEKPGQPDLNGNTNAPRGESGTNPEGMGNPSPRNKT